MSARVLLLGASTSVSLKATKDRDQANGQYLKFTFYQPQIIEMAII
jgi:hypothetical protein